MQYQAHDYQKRATQLVIDIPRIGLFLDMGLGKTVITMTAIQELMFDRFEVSRVLVIAPKRVAEDTWTREHAKWDHLKDLRISKVLGNEQQRVRALKAEADIYVIGRDNVIWLTEYYQGLRKGWPFDMIVIDELSSFKNPQAKRFRALRKVIPLVKRVVGLTGTPSPNGMMDLWAEVYLLDQGERLGKTLGAYREKYFRPGARNGYVVYKWEPYRNAQKEIEDKISDICISMSAADYLKLPERIDNIIPVQLSPAEMQAYKTMESEQLLQIEDEDIAALNAAAVMTKLLQVANGSVYSVDGSIVRIHDAKLEALAEIIDTTDGPVLVFYSYKHDLAAIQGKVKDARVLNTAQDMIDDGHGGKVFTPLSDIYNGYLDDAIIGMAEGAYDYNTMVRRVVGQMTASGLRSDSVVSDAIGAFVTYASGWHNRIDVAARRALLTGFGQLAGKVTDMNAQRLGTDYFEVTWHAGARPSHMEWQGKVYKKRDLVRICGLGTGPGLLGWNCRHTYYPFIPGISTRSYSDEWLEKKNADEATPKKYRGKEYTAYEATQRQRQLETAMRAQRERVQLLRQAEADKKDIVNAQCKYQALMNEYKSFSSTMHLPTQMERVYTGRTRGRIAPSPQTYAKWQAEQAEKAANRAKEKAERQRRADMEGGKL